MTCSPYDLRPRRIPLSQDSLADMPQRASAIDQFRATARRSPEAPAVLYVDRAISFGALDRLSSRFAAALRGLGIEQGDRVALCLENIPQFWIAQLAAWKAGASVVALCPLLPAADLAARLADSGTRVLVAMEDQYARVAAPAAAAAGMRHVITTSALDFLGGERPPRWREVTRQSCPGALDLLELCLHYADANDPQVGIQADDLAMTWYSTVSDDAPLAQHASHGELARSAEGYCARFDLAGEDVLVAATPLFVPTGSAAAITAAALIGAPVILTYRFDAVELLRLAQRWHGTILLASSGALETLAAIERQQLASLRRVFTSDSRVSPELEARWQALAGCEPRRLPSIDEAGAAVPQASMHRPIAAA